MIPNNCSNVSPDQRGKAASCSGCPFQKQCQQASDYKDPNIDKIKEKLSNVKNIILVLSGKGGVGKSTVSSQIALSLSENKDLQIGLLDIDICGPSIPKMLNLEDEEVHQSIEGWSIIIINILIAPVYKEDNLAVMSIGFLLSNKNNAVIWRGPRKNGLIVQFLTEVNWDNLDYLIIDTPPGTSDEHLSIITYLKGCNLLGAIIVTTPQEIALIDVRKEINFCQKTETKIIGVIENMSGFICPHCKECSNIFSVNSGGAEAMCKEFGLPLIGKIPIEMNIGFATENGKSLTEEFSESPSSREIKKIIKTIIDFKYTKI